MFTVAALYQFTRFEDPAEMRGPLLARALDAGVRGTLLLAPEGINGTISGSRAGIDTVIEHIQTLPGCANIEWKESTAREMPFPRMKVRVKREIVTMGQPGIDPRTAVGHYVAPEEWNELISSEDVVVIDTRNDYEIEIGTFEGAVNPATRSFGEFPAWWQANRDDFAGKRIAMFCTGGIRCEKSTNFLISKGIEDVYHLKGGILKYLEEVPERESLWRGECFVFDKRVSVAHGLVEGTYDMCHACGRPLGSAAKELPAYERGVSCPSCLDEYSEADRARFRERQRQIDAREHEKALRSA